MVQMWEMRGREFSDLNKLDSHLLRGQGWNGDLEVTGWEALKEIKTLVKSRDHKWDRYVKLVITLTSLGSTNDMVSAYVDGT